MTILRKAPATAVPATAVPHPSPMTEREARAQSAHRLQVGLLGLCAMLLIVGLANIIMDRARRADAANAPAALASDGPHKPASDPLADIGVVPAADPSAAASPAGPH